MPRSSPNRGGAGISNDWCIRKDAEREGENETEIKRLEIDEECAGDTNWRQKHAGEGDHEANLSYIPFLSVPKKLCLLSW